MIKRSLMFLFAIILLTSLVLAENEKIEVSTLKPIFGAGENITFKVTLLNENNNPINQKVNVILTDAENRVEISREVEPNKKFVSINPTDQASYGTGKIIAIYNELQAKTNFEIEAKQKVEFDLAGDTLTVKNTGNTLYDRTIQITIGETTGIKHPKIKIGEKIDYKLIAPEGTYQIKVTDGITSRTFGETKLTGTGNVVGAIDEKATKSTSVTGGISPEEDSEGELAQSLKNKKFVYVFILVIFGMTILLAIEKQYKKKINRK